MGNGGRSSGGTSGGLVGIGMAIVTVVQLVIAGIVIARPVPLGGVQVVALGGAGIVTIVLLALAPLPRAAKASLTALLCAAGMAVISTQDPLGMRAVNKKVAAAIGKGAATAPAVAESGPLAEAAGSGRVTIRTATDSDDRDFAPSLTQTIEQQLDDPATAGIRVNGTAAVDLADRRGAYSVSWSVADSGVSRWCGRIAATMPNRSAAVTGLAAIIGRSAGRIASGATSCS